VTLDYHRDQQEYIAAKSSITKFQNGDDFAVINCHFGKIQCKSASSEKAKRLFSRKNQLEEGCLLRMDKLFNIRGLARDISGFQNPQRGMPLGTANKSKFPFPISKSGTHNLETSARPYHCQNFECR